MAKQSSCGVIFPILMILLTSTPVNASDMFRTIDRTLQILQRTNLPQQQREQHSPKEQQRQYEEIERQEQRRGALEQNGALIQRIQYRLREMNYDPGPLDGVMGPKTRGSIAAFQRDYGLMVDGRANETLLYKLEEAIQQVNAPTPSGGFGIRNADNDTSSPLTLYLYRQNDFSKTATQELSRLVLAQLDVDARMTHMSTAQNARSFVRSMGHSAEAEHYFTSSMGWNANDEFERLRIQQEFQDQFVAPEVARARELPLDLELVYPMFLEEYVISLGGFPLRKQGVEGLEYRSSTGLPGVGRLILDIPGERPDFLSIPQAEAQQLIQLLQHRRLYLKADVSLVKINCDQQAAPLVRGRVKGVSFYADPELTRLVQKIDPPGSPAIRENDAHSNPHPDFPVAEEPTFIDLLAYYIASVPDIADNDQFILAYAALYDCDNLLRATKNEFMKHKYLPEARQILIDDIEASQKLPPKYYRVKKEITLYGQYDFNRQEFPFQPIGNSGGLISVAVPESIECLQNRNRFSVSAVTGNTPMERGFRLSVNNGTVIKGLPISPERAEKLVSQIDTHGGGKGTRASRDVILELVVTPKVARPGNRIIAQIVGARVIDPNSDDVLYTYDSSIFKSQENLGQNNSAQALSIPLAPNVHFVAAFARFSDNGGELIDAVIKKTTAYTSANEFNRPKVLEEERNKVSGELVRIDDGEPVWRGGTIEFGEYDLDAQTFAVKDVSLNGWRGDGYNRIVDIVIANSNLFSNVPMNPEVARNLIDNKQTQGRQFPIVARITPTGTRRADSRGLRAIGALVVNVDEAYIIERRKTDRQEDGRYTVEIEPDQIKAHVKASETTAPTSPLDASETHGESNIVTANGKERYISREDATSWSNSAHGTERKSRQIGTAAISDNPCQTANPHSIDDVFKCMAAGRLPDRAYDCRSMVRTWLGRLTKLGRYTPDEAMERLPDCKIFAQVAKEIYGVPPYWAQCVRYGEKDARKHLDECLSTYLPEYTGNSNVLKKMAGCEQIQNEYEMALKASDSEHRLPDGYVPPDCDVANALVAKWTGKDPAAHPCTGFDPDDIAGHVSKCFGSSSASASLRSVKNCVNARNEYEQKLREAYGDLPEKYIMAKCSELEPLLAMAEKYRTEAAAKAKETARSRKELKRRRTAKANEEINRRGYEAIKRYKSVAGAATGMVENPIKPFPKGECDISFEGYNQQGVLQALYSRKFDALKENRIGVLFYIAAFHNTIAEAAENTMDKNCMGILDQRLTKVAADEILTHMGLEPGGSLDSFASSGLGALLGILNEVASNPAGIQQDEMNKTVLQNQGKADAVLVMTNIGCQSDVTNRLYENARHFVYNTQPN